VRKVQTYHPENLKSPHTTEKVSLHQITQEATREKGKEARGRDEEEKSKLPRMVSL
jgi:hypothetical protein